MERLYYRSSAEIKVLLVVFRMNLFRILFWGCGLVVLYGVEPKIENIFFVICLNVVGVYQGVR